MIDDFLFLLKNRFYIWIRVYFQLENLIYIVAAWIYAPKVVHHTA